MTPETADTAPLTAAELDVCVNVGTRLGSGEIDAVTALEWLQGWVRQGVQGQVLDAIRGTYRLAQVDDDDGAFVMPLWLGALLPGWVAES